tara:strand:- start:45431 stop:47650 length:2220 start_codon:yes stop_codon:yes gene_type:complete
MRMTEQGDAPSPNRKVSAEFAAVQAELEEEDSLMSMMMEQLPSMLGMAFMFIVTIAIALFIRPWYDVANLQAFGEAGATQVRYIVLELVMIFIFTAAILALARYKKEWVIKYGIMFVLAIALMYSTVPLAHMLVVDLEPEPFEYQQDSSVDSSYLGHYGLDTHLTHSLIGEGFTWNDSIEAYSGEGFVEGIPDWTMTHQRLPYADQSVLQMVVSENYYTFSNEGYVWYVDAVTGELQDTYNCHSVTVNEDETTNLAPLGSLGSLCTMAWYADDAVYVINQDNVLTRFNVFQESPGLLAYQAAWRLPEEINTNSRVLHAELIDDDKVFIASSQAILVIELERTAPAFDPMAPSTEIPAKILLQVNASSNFTSADFGHSPWSTANMSNVDSGEGFILLGEENGRVTGIEWNATAEEPFTVREALNEVEVGDTVQSVRISDLDNSGLTDLMITTDDETRWLHTTSLINRLTIPVGENHVTAWTSVDSNGTYQFHSVEMNGSITLHSGEVTEDMYGINGLVLEDGPLIVGMLVALVLMILLYVHSEWYVVNTVGVLVGSGVVVMLGVTFVPTLIMLFMVLAAIYDAWAVYKSKHMLDLADTMIGLRLPILLVAPQEKGYSFLEETTSMKQNNAPQAVNDDAPQRIVKKKKKSKDAMFMGLGDVIFPGMLVLSAAQYLEGSEAMIVAMTTLIGGLFGYVALMTYVARGRAQAGLPLLNGGAILGYIIGGLLFIGTGIFTFGITL